MDSKTFWTPLACLIQSLQDVPRRLCSTCEGLLTTIQRFEHVVLWRLHKQDNHALLLLPCTGVLLISYKSEAIASSSLCFAEFR